MFFFDAFFLASVLFTLSTEKRHFSHWAGSICTRGLPCFTWAQRLLRPGSSRLPACSLPDNAQNRAKDRGERAEVKTKAGADLVAGLL